MKFGLIRRLDISKTFKIQLLPPEKLEDFDYIDRIRLSHPVRVKRY